MNTHESDCATHNEPAIPNSDCDCRDTVNIPPTDAITNCFEFILADTDPPDFPDPDVQEAKDELSAVIAWGEQGWKLARELAECGVGCHVETLYDRWVIAIEALKAFDLAIEREGT